ncbi:MAG: hypothetical protein WDM79_11390 [Terricaulis sp.]
MIARLVVFLISLLTVHPAWAGAPRAEETSAAPPCADSGRGF